MFFKVFELNWKSKVQPYRQCYTWTIEAMLFICNHKVALHHHKCHLMAWTNSWPEKSINLFYFFAFILLFHDIWVKLDLTKKKKKTDFDPMLKRLIVINPENYNIIENYNITFIFTKWKSSSDKMLYRNKYFQICKHSGPSSTWKSYCVRKSWLWRFLFTIKKCVFHMTVYLKLLNLTRAQNVN